MNRQHTVLRLFSALLVALLAISGSALAYAPTYEPPREGPACLEFDKIDCEAIWEETIGWTISKSAKPTQVTVCEGDEAEVCYTITVDKTTTCTPVTLCGIITLKNTGTETPQNFVLTINLKKGLSTIDQTVINALAGNGRYPYSFTLSNPQPGSYTLAAKVEMSNGKGAFGAASVYLAKKTTGYAAIHVADGAESWEFHEGGTVKYTTKLSCADEGIKCNIATITETGQSAQADVKVICKEKERKPLEVETSCIDPFVYRPTLRVHFIVTNPNPVAVEVPFGLANALEPACYQGSQPTLFAPGESEFEIEIGRHEILHWLLDGKVAIASKRTSVCTQQDDVYIAGVAVFADADTNGLYDAGDTLLTPNPDGVIGEIYLVDCHGKVVDSKVLGPELFFRAGRMVNFNFRQVWGEFYLVPQLRVALPAGYRIYPNYRIVHTGEYPEAFYSLYNDFGLVPASFVPDSASNLDLPRLEFLAEWLDHPYKPALAKTMTTAAEVAAVPTNLVLAQNYPNPFNPQTTIRYDLPAQSHVTLSVFDVTGALVTRLVDGEQTAGSYQQVWNAAGNPSGLYFYELRTPGFREMRRMLLLK